MRLRRGHGHVGATVARWPDQVAFFAVEVEIETFALFVGGNTQADGRIDDLQDDQRARDREGDGHHNRQDLLAQEGGVARQ